MADHVRPIDRPYCGIMRNRERQLTITHYAAEIETKTMADHVWPIDRPYCGIMRNRERQLTIAHYAAEIET